MQQRIVKQTEKRIITLRRKIGDSTPVASGVGIYIKKLLGEKYEFLFGWITTFILFPVINAILALMFAVQFTSFMWLSESEQKSLAVGLIIFVSIINILCNKVGRKLITAIIVGLSTVVMAFGIISKSLVLAGTLIIIAIALSAFLMIGARIPHSMAVDNLFIFKGFFGRLEGKSKITVKAIIFECMISYLYVLCASFNTLAEISLFIAWLFFIILIASVLRSRQNYKSIILCSIVLTIALIGVIYVALSNILNGNISALFTIVIIIMGIPVYLYVKLIQSVY